MLATLKTQVAGSRLLQMALPLLVLVFSLLALAPLRHATRVAWDQARAAERDLTGLQTDATAADWPARRATALRLSNQASERIWRQPTLGLAQSRVLDWVAHEAERSAIPRADVSLVADAKGRESEGFWLVRVRVRTVFDIQRLNRLLSAADLSPQLIYVERLEVSGDPLRQMELILVAPFARPAATAGHAR
jgi:hypothetical protein